MPDNNELERIRYLQDYYSGEYDTVIRSISSYNMLLASLNRTKETIKNAKKISDANILVSIDSNVFIGATTKAVDQVITSIGAGYFIEKSPDDAEQFVSGNIEKVSSNLKTLDKQRDALAKELYKLSISLSSQVQQ